MLKQIEKTLDNVPEQYHDLYTKDEHTEEWLLTGIETTKILKDRLDQFRLNNTKEIQMREALSKQVESLPGLESKIAELESALEVAKAANEGSLDQDSINKMVDERTNMLTQNHQKELEARAKAEAELQAKLDSLQIDLNKRVMNELVSKAVADIGVAQPGALGAIALEANETFVIEDGVPVAKDPKGLAIYDPKTNGPLTVEQWVKNLHEDRGYYWKADVGGGAGGSDPEGGTTASNQRPGGKINPRGVGNLDGLDPEKLAAGEYNHRFSDS